MTCYIIYRN